MTQTLVPDDLIKSEDARLQTPFGKDTWREFIDRGELPTARIGRSRYVRADDVRALIAKQFAA